MSDVLEQAKRLVDLDAKVGDNNIGTDELREFNLLRGCGFTFAHALIETHQRLEEATRALEKIRRYTSHTVEMGDDMVRIAAEEAYEVAKEILDSIEEKESTDNE